MLPYRLLQTPFLARCRLGTDLAPNKQTVVGLVHLVCFGHLVSPVLAYPVACQVIENARTDLGWLKVGQ